MQNSAFFEVSGALYCNRNVNNETETYSANFYIVTSENLEQSRI